MSDLVHRLRNGEWIYNDVLAAADEIENLREWQAGALKNRDAERTEIDQLRAQVENARAQAIEECAQVAEAHSDWIFRADDIAKFIRELSEPPAPYQVCCTCANCRQEKRRDADPTTCENDQ